MKNIVFFISSMSSGGAEHQLAVLAGFLVERGFNVTIVTFADIPDFYELDPRINRIMLAQGKKSVLKFLIIMKFFLKTKADCVISFDQRNNLFALIPLVFNLKPKVIVGERNLTYGASSYLEKVLFRFLYRRADWIVPNSYSQTHYIETVAPHLKSKLATITNYTDLNKYCPHFQTREKEAKMRIGVFCRYHPQKNYERLAQAIKIVKGKCGASFSVFCFGNQTTKSMQMNPHYLKLKALTEELDIQDVLYLYDHTRNVPAEMEKLDVVCLPSLFEGFSNSLSEAICCGKPVIASDVSDNSLMVKNGRNGLLFNPESVEDIAVALFKILEQSSERLSEMGKQSRKIAESLFNAKDFVDRYINLIENERNIYNSESPKVG